MYGALIALPFVAYAAVIALERITRFVPSVFMLTLAAAGVIVVNQALDSPSESVYQAAQFLERYDPVGPYRIEAPGRTRTRMQAYVSGCPRFTMRTGTTPSVWVRLPPSAPGLSGLKVKSWIHYLRMLFEVPEISTDWYGPGDRVYVVTVGSDGAAPLGAKPLFAHGNVTVFSKP